MENKLYYGAAYYPELWDEKAIEQDIQYMTKAGINVVRMGEFAWSTMEPKEDKIDISYFVDIINRLNENGIKTIICTPTPTPPIWMSHNHPERMFVNRDGVVMSHGARQHCCTNNNYFIDRTKIIAEALAKATGKLDGVIGWQIDNEFKCHVAECYCETCKSLWHTWLEKEYKTIENLNELWGTAIWSESYLSFNQVPQPVATPFIHNASLSQAYMRFSREKINEYCHLQANIIRKYSKRPITHNSHRWFSLDNEKLFEKLDFVAFDDYPTSNDYHIMLFNYDFFRNLKSDKPFWVMETSANHAGCLVGAPKPHPENFLRAEAASAYIFGAQGFSHWLWRQQRTGCEQPHGSLLYSWGKPTTGYSELQKAMHAKNELEPYLINSKLQKSDIAITFSDLGRISLQVEPLNGCEYLSLLEVFYKRLLALGVNRDIIPEGHSFDGYKILLSPFIACLKHEYIERAEKFVSDGGIWIVGPMTGYRTAEHTVPVDAGLGVLESIAGVETKYIFPFDGSGIKGEAFGITSELSMLGMVFENVKGKVLGTITDGIVKGSPFITEYQLGKGKIVMLGAMPAKTDNQTMLDNILLNYIHEAGCVPDWKLSDGLVAVKRITAQGEQLVFAIDMKGNGGSIEINKDFEILIGEKTEKAKINLAPYSYVVVKLKNK
jgi:beta-galactosidase